MKYVLEVVSTSPEATQKIGTKLARRLAAGDTLFLSGELGAGKTCLVQGVAKGLGVSEYAQSPSFVLVRELYGDLPLYHVDLYRLDHIEEIADLGLDDYLYGSGVCVVEWAEKGSAVLPAEHMEVQIDYLSDNERRLRLVPHGRRYVDLLKELKSDLREGAVAGSD
ncbi:MAG: tRNA (adenosine(37)-N6)-threonylcarbamoyltransferase complex ATPase subunit type 1 TsaE [Dehalococcoidia bacterium]|nr:MAG: tRNA (adenosine(37)-N6)-threonylcarbamoyltransferase complex ATPase subunit type 1 TsaE [Dehalococcoidia bacterium]